MFIHINVIGRDKREACPTSLANCHSLLEWTLNKKNARTYEQDDLKYIKYLDLPEGHICKMLLKISEIYK